MSRSPHDNRTSTDAKRINYALGAYHAACSIESSLPPSLVRRHLDPAHQSLPFRRLPETFGQALRRGQRPAPDHAAWLRENASAPVISTLTDAEGLDALAHGAREFPDLVTRGLLTLPGS
jgi:hypothetical protein